MYFNDGSWLSLGEPIFAKENGQWKGIGNQILILIDRPTGAALTWIKADQTTLVKTGMTIGAFDHGGRNINSMRIEGPGLPAGGITASKTQASVNQLILDIQDNTLPTHFWDFIPMNDTTISNLSEAKHAYTITLYSNQTAPPSGSPYAQQFTGAIGKKPPLNADLNATYFGSITAPGINHTIGFAEANILNKTVTFDITKVTAFIPSIFGAGVDFWSNSSPGKVSVAKFVPQSASSVSIVVPPAAGFTPSMGFIKLETHDPFGRYFFYLYMFQ